MEISQSELRTAMKNQKITYESLEKKLKISRQTISKRATDFMNGERIPNSDLEVEFNRILQIEQFHREQEDADSIASTGDREIKKTKASIEKIAKNLCETLNIDADKLHQLLDLFSNSESDEYQKALNELVNDNTINQMKINFEMILLKDNLEDLKILTSRRKMMDRAEEFAKLWDNTKSYNGRPTEFVDGTKTKSFAMYYGEKCQIVAEINDDRLSDNLVNVVFEILVLTDRSLNVIAKEIADKTEYHTYSAKFDGIIPGYKYFYRVGLSKPALDDEKDDFMMVNLDGTTRKLRDDEYYMTEFGWPNPLIQSN